MCDTLTHSICFIGVHRNFHTWGNSVDAICFIGVHRNFQTWKHSVNAICFIGVHRNFQTWKHSVDAICFIGGTQELSYLETQCGRHMLCWAPFFWGSAFQPLGRHIQEPLMCYARHKNSLVPLQNLLLSSYNATVQF